MKRIILVLLSGVLFAAVLQAQPKSSGNNRATIEGVVVEAGPAAVPVGFATVHLLPQDVFATTDESGNFELKNIEPGKTEIKIQFIGMETIDTTLNVVAGRNYTLRFVMTEANFRLEEVTVLATQSKAGSSTASNISRQAMDHLQTSSLKDIMQLLPGVSISNPSLTDANIISIRTLSNSKDDASRDMNSLGTAIIVDGSPLSNNANLQLLSGSMPGSSSGIGGSDPAAGVDLRSLSTDNIESVEVIRGIPSAEYGDLTSGAVIIKSKAGKEPLTVRFKTNPSIYQVSLSKGLDLGKNKGSLNISGDYAYSTASQTEAYVYYQRFNVKALYSKTFAGNVSTNTSLDINYGMDKRDKNPDDIRSQLATGATDIGFRFNSNGTINTPEAGWLKNIRYSLSLGYTDKKSYREQILSNAFSLYSMSMQDGAVISNRPGQPVYDKNGQQISHILPGEEGLIATYLPYEYFSRYDIYGKELNLFAKVTSNFSKRWERNNNRILFGADFKSDGNLGRGTVYDMNTPPKAGTGSSFRPRPFSDIPFINQLGVFLEDYYTHSFGERDLNITAGVRFDYINGKTSFSPRINASFDIVPKMLTVRGGYGINAKAPTAIYLYPQDAYFDYANFNNLGTKDVPESEQLLLATTRVFNTENPDLKIAKNEKYEVGLDLKVNRVRFSVTAYKDEMKDGYTFGKDFSCFNLIPYEVYKIAERIPGGIPRLELENTYNVFAMYNKPLNSLSTVNKGLEYELDFGRINSIRTSFYINGAWMSTKTRSMEHSFSTAANLDELERNIGVYEKGVETACKEKFNTTFRITHNIPKIGFVLTLTAQVDWKTKLWSEYGNDTMFEKYISRLDGKVYDFDPAKKDDPEFSYLFPSLNDNRFIAESYQPTVIFNFMLSKEIGNFLTASFFVNNMFNSRPLYRSKRFPGSLTELGIPTFFGFDIKINIR